jgi:hypothetical protein
MVRAKVAFDHFRLVWERLLVARFQTARFEWNRWLDPSVNPRRINTRVQT